MSFNPTVDSVLALCPCENYTASRVAELLLQEPVEALCSIPFNDALWYLKRVLSQSQLLLWVRQCALSVVHLWSPVPVVLEWLKTGDETLQAAAYAAAYAAYAAANAAADAAYAAANAAYAAAANAAYAAANAAANAAYAAAAAVQAAAAADAADAAAARAADYASSHAARKAKQRECIKLAVDILEGSVVP